MRLTPNRGEGGHQDREDIQDASFSGPSEKFDSDKAAGEEELKGDDSDSNGTLVVALLKYISKGRAIPTKIQSERVVYGLRKKSRVPR